MQNMKTGRLTFEWGSRTYVMGILNVTPDSFSGDGVLKEGGDWVERSVAQARQFFADGADLIDIGGESTRPGFTYVPVEEEIGRIVPVVQRLVPKGWGRFPSIPIKPAWPGPRWQQAPTSLTISRRCAVTGQWERSSSSITLRLS